jgi:hypothetical protein
MDRDVSTETKKAKREPILNKANVNRRTKIELTKKVKRFERYGHVVDAKAIVSLVERNFAGVNEMPDMIEHPNETKMREREERRAAKAAAASKE